jgi:hypothetical protein
MCLSSGQWWLVHSRSLRCGRFLWTSRGPRCMQSDPFWTRGVGRGAFSTSWSGRGTVQRRDAGEDMLDPWMLREFHRLHLDRPAPCPPGHLRGHCWSCASRGGTVTTSAEVGPSPCSAVDITGLLAIAVARLQVNFEYLS